MCLFRCKIILRFTCLCFSEYTLSVSFLKTSHLSEPGFQCLCAEVNVSLHLIFLEFLVRHLQGWLLHAGGLSQRSEKQVWGLQQVQVWPGSKSTQSSLGLLPHSPRGFFSTRILGEGIPGSPASLLLLLPALNLFTFSVTCLTLCTTFKEFI